MMPTYYPDDEVLASYMPYLFKKPQQGDVIIFVKKDTYYVKRIQGTENSEYHVVGDNKSDSRDSRVFGNIAKSAIIGKVIWKISS